MFVTQLSNLFNLIAENDPEINFYHMGFPADMEKDIQNNFDANGETGSLFPYLLLTPPIWQPRVEPNGTSSLYDTYQLDYLLFDTYNYNSGQLDYKTDTSVLIFAKLQQIFLRINSVLLAYSDTSPFRISDPTVTLDPYDITVNARGIRVQQSLIFPSICIYTAPDISYLPDTVEGLPTYDLEDPINKIPI